jgi:L-fuconolactonase
MSDSHTPKQSLNGSTEEVVQPDLPIVDSHIHLWNLTGFDYFAPEFLADVAAGHKVEASVYVECGMAYSDNVQPEMKVVGETEYVLRQIEEAKGSSHNLCAAILGSADMSLGDRIQPVLEAHVQAGQGKFKGIRSRVAWDPDPIAGYGETGYPSANIVRSDSFFDAARHIRDLGLVLDVWGFHTQLDDVHSFASKVPDLSVVVDHVGGPLGVGPYAGKRKEVFEVWSSGIHRLAELPNVNIKLSGLGISRMGFKFAGGGQAQSSDELVEAWSPYIDTCVEAFGAGRCIFGSNFPVDRAAASYRVLLNAYKKMLSGLNDDDRQAIFSGNAKRVYGI